MAESKTGLWVALIGGAATVIAAFFAYLGVKSANEDKSDPPPRDTATAAPAENKAKNPINTGAVLGTIVVPPPYKTTVVFSDPYSVAPLGEIFGGQQVEIVCIAQGPVSPGSVLGQTSNWARIKYNNGIAYINDGMVGTPTKPPPVPPCE